jgi:uncharacterized protein (DUF1697 family)
MASLFAFLRAINVGGHTVTMAKLRGIFEDLGFDDVETFIASGNVIFSSPSKSIAALERKIEDRLQDSLGYQVVTFIRTAPEVVAIASYRPFPEVQIRSAGASCVGFMAQPLDAAARRSLAALKSEIDDFQVNDREVYWLCKLKQSESKFSNAVFERTTGVRVTFRGANTVARLAVKAGARS